MFSRPKMLFFLPLVLMLGYGPAACGQMFTNPVRVATPVDPDTVVAGDLNGDGRVDLIWFEVTSTENIGHVELAQPNGGYLSGAQVIIPGAPYGVPMCATADVTQDSKLDLICARLDSISETSTVIVFPGNGDGSFGTPIFTQFASQYGEAILFTLVGDPNADGVPDFILDNDYTPAQVLLSDGKGGFLPAKTVPTSYNSSTPIAADINGDGIPDILWPEGAAVALGNGDGSFGSLIEPYSPPAGPITCAFHDMDGDGKLDAVCGSFANNGNLAGTELDILHGNGDGTFNPAPIAHQAFGNASIGSSGSGDFETPLLVRDLNGDGIPDVLAFSGDGLAVLLGQPGLTFGTPSHYAPAFSGYAFSSRVAAQTVYTDLNGDGLIDVLDAGPNGMYLLYGHADGSFGSAVATKVSEVSGHIAVADFNGDGKPDIVSTGAPRTSLSLGNGDGTFAAPVAVPGAPFDDIAPIYVADFNGDGKPDLLSLDALSDAPPAYYLMLGKGDGTFASPVKTTGLPASLTSTDAITGDNVPYPLTSDLNSDGKADFFYTAFQPPSGYSLISALSAGDGTFHDVTTTYPAPEYLNTYYYTPIAPVLADFAHRGKLDAAYYLNENLYIVQGNGDGSFAATPSMLATPTVAGVQANYFQALQVADFDGDGNLDIAFLSWFQPVYFYQGGPSCLFLYFGNGDGTFAAPIQAGCFTHDYTDMRVADFNGDGRPDLVLQTASTLNNFAVGIIDNLGGRTFGPEINYTAGALSGDFFVADLNGDGRPDLVFGNQQYYVGETANSVTVLLNQQATVATGTLTSTPNPSYFDQPFNITATLTPPSAGTVYAGAISFSIDGVSFDQAALSGNAATITGNSTLLPGTHSLSATWSGDANDPALMLNATQMVLPFPIQVSLSCSPASTAVGQSVLLATQFALSPPTGAGPVPSAPYTGTLSFYDGGLLLEQQPVATAGFNYSTSNLPGGTHTLSVSYSGDPIYANGSASCSENVDKLPTTSQLSSSSTGVAGTAFLFVGKVAAASATTLEPTGTVSFTVDGASAGTGNVDPPTGIATFNDPGLSGGNHTLACTYSGDADFAASVCPPVALSVAAAPSVLALTSSANPAAAGSPIVFTANLLANNKPAAGDVVTFTLSASGVPQAQGSATTDANGNATYSSLGLLPGTYAVSALFAGNANLQNALSPTLMQVVVINPTATSLIASPNPGYTGDSVSLTATVTAMGTMNSVPPVPSGAVAFFDGATMIGSATRNASGVATFTTASLTVGVHSLTASYPASPLFLGSISPPYSETVLASSFAVGLSPSTITVVSGKTGASTIDLTSFGTFAGPLTLTHGAPPTYGTLSISQATVTLTAGGTGTSTITLNTLDTSAEAMAARPGSRFGSRKTLVAVPAAVLLLLPLLSRRKRILKTLLLASTAILVQGLLGCGDSFYTAHAVAPGTYTMPVTATDTNGNSKTAKLTVIVTP